MEQHISSEQIVKEHSLDHLVLAPNTKPNQDGLLISLMVLTIVVNTIALGTVVIDHLVHH